MKKNVLKLKKILLCDNKKNRSSIDSYCTQVTNCVLKINICKTVKVRQRRIYSTNFHMDSVPPQLAKYLTEVRDHNMKIVGD